MTETGPLYRETRERVTALVRDLDDEVLRGVVPACPAWTIHDVVAHVTGVCVDIIEGRLEGVATDPWTDAQVAARRGAPIGEILAEWNEYAPRCEEIAHLFPDGSDVQWLADLTTHEHDIRGAVGAPGARDSASVAAGFPWLADRFGRSLDARGIPPLRFVTTEEAELVAGTGDAAASLTAPRFELFRALTGRRSAAQIAAMRWDGDPEPYVAALAWGPFRPAASDVTE